MKKKDNLAKEEKKIKNKMIFAHWINKERITVGFKMVACELKSSIKIEQMIKFWIWNTAKCKL